MWQELVQWCLFYSCMSVSVLYRCGDMFSLHCMCLETLMWTNKCNGTKVARQRTGWKNDQTTGSRRI